jgi:hypothetical protein
MQINLKIRLSLIALLLFVISACGGKSNLTPFASPTPGEWSGENGSFTLLENNEISNFNWVLNHEEYQSRCPISLTENLIVTDGKADLTFTNQNSGKISFVINIVFTSANEASLSYEYDFCPSTRSIYFDQDGKTRSFTGETKFNQTEPKQ